LGGRARLAASQAQAVSENWERITTLFGAARLLDADKRAAFLDAACGQDAVLRTEVERLLADSERDDSFLDPSQFAGSLLEAAAGFEAPNLAPGTRLAGYEVGAHIGSGGMGDVYRARDLRLNRAVAIKVLPTSVASDPERRSRFEREAQAVAALNHPNIVTIHSVEEADGRFFLTMELVEGHSLADVVVEGGLPLDGLLDIAIPLVDAVAAAHQKGITHRDLKPANIMLGSGEHKGRIKVLDFGLAKLADERLGPAGITALPTKPITAEGRILGTVAYMSPEQAEGKPIDARSDLFSLGVILFEMATGRRPFAGDTSVSIISSILKDTPPSVTELNPSLPRDLGRIVRRALQKDPDRRYQTAKDLRSDLEELKASLDSGELAMPTATSGSVPRASSGSTTKGRTIAVAATLVVLALAGGYLTMAWRSRSAAPASAQASSALDDLQIVPLTTTGNAQEPAISPDGKYVAYIQHDGNDYSLWIRQTATASNVRIVAPQPGVRIDIPTVAPDSNYVDFVRSRPGPLVLDVWRVPFLGGTPKRIVDNVQSGVGWSHDGRHMAFLRVDLAASAASTTLVLADSDGSHERVLVTRRLPMLYFSLSNGIVIRPSWSPDDTSIALVGGNGRNQPQLVAIDTTSGVERIVPVEGRPSTVAWLGRDALAISRQTDEATPQQLWRVSYPSGMLSRLTNDLSDYVSFDVTADGRSLAAAQSDTRVGVLVGDATGNQGAEVVAPAHGVGGLAWTAGRLLYAAINNRVPAIMAVVPGRGTPEEIISKRSDPSVASDGRTLVSLSTERGFGDSVGIWKAGVDGSHPVRLVSTPSYAPHIADHDRQVIFVSLQGGQQTLWTTPIDGGPPTVLSNTFAFSPDVSADGESIVFLTLDEQRRPIPMVCELPACSPRRIAVPANFGAPVRWMPGGQSIAYVDHTSPLNLWAQSLDGGPPRQLTHFTDGRRITDFAWSRDGKRLAIALATTTNDIVLFKGLKR
jgi:eukaryotic-like serine/threonine-protein kinase